MSERLLEPLVVVAALLDHLALVLLEPLPARDRHDGARRLVLPARVGGRLPVGILGAGEGGEEEGDVPGGQFNQGNNNNTAQKVETASKAILSKSAIL